ncbi:MAG: homoserine kinase [Chloroflexi bacterium]|nr:homoserine kinase [Chloroflexota bacterium]
MPTEANTRAARTSISIYAPATVANLGVGFDILGLALDAPGDRVTVECADSPGVELVAITGDGGQLTCEPARNTACVAARETLQAIRPGAGIRLWLHKGLPLASGLGSSAASAVAAAVAVNELFGGPLTPFEVLRACVEAEAAVSGRHADNVAPALLGGIVLVTGWDLDAIYRLPVPDNLYLALVTPAVAVPTLAARAVLPENVPLRTMVHHTGSVAALIHALHTGDLALLARAMRQDTVVSPRRAALIPGLDEAHAAAYDAGALASVISGAGPTLCALCDTPRTAQAVTQAYKEVYNRLGIGCVTRVARPNLTGARICAD